jgi:hypothetical protein
MRGEAHDAWYVKKLLPSPTSHPRTMFDARMVAGHDRAMRHGAATVTAIRFALSAPCDVLVDLPTRHQKVAAPGRHSERIEAIELVGGEC